MSAKTIKSALGLLQDDPDHAQAWQQLQDEVSGDTGMAAGDLLKLLEAARRAHEARRETDAVAALLAVDAKAASGTPREAELLTELARVLDEELLDDDRARAAYQQLLTLRPEDATVAEAIERSEARRTKWRDLVDRYMQEAAGTNESAFRSSLLVSSAEVIYRFGREGSRSQTSENIERMVSQLREALALDPKNRRAEMLIERVLRKEGRWEELTQALMSFSDESALKDEKIAGWVRLARVFAKKLHAPDRAAAAYERALDLAPGHQESSSFLADHFTSHEMWDHLVALYEGQLSSGALRAKEDEFGAVLQVAMVHWRMRGKPEAAEAWFERLRKLEPANSGMLGFFREWCTSRGESTRLATILTDAQRVMPDGKDRSAIGAEIAKLAEEGANAQKAIEQWRTVLRQDPRNEDARHALRRLYRQTASWNALTDLLRQELEKVSQDDAAGRLGILRDIAGIYRDHVKSDSALVTVLTQVVNLDPTDIASVRELVRVYEALQRWRDLLTMQARQADLEPEPTVKAELWRVIARRWLDQFSNVQNAVEAYEKLRAVDPDDREAAERLKELYVKRRARTSPSTISWRKRPTRHRPAGAARPMDGDGEACRGATGHGRAGRRPLQAGARGGTLGIGCARRAREAGRARQGLRHGRRSAGAARCDCRGRCYAPRRAPKARRSLFRTLARPRQGHDRLAARACRSTGPPQGATRPPRQLSGHWRLRRPLRTLCAE